MIIGCHAFLFTMIAIIALGALFTASICQIEVKEKSVDVCADTYEVIATVIICNTIVCLILLVTVFKFSKSVKKRLGSASDIVIKKLWLFNGVFCFG